MRVRPLIATVIGDPGGIGPEVCVKALAARGNVADATPLLIGSLHALQQAARVCEVDLRFAAVASPEMAIGDPDSVYVLDPGDLARSDIIVGSGSAACSRAVLAWIRLARGLAEQRRVQGWILAPVDNASLQRVAGDAAVHELEPPGTFQLRIGGSLRVVPISEHIRMRDVPDAVKRDHILRLVELLDVTLKSWGMPAARIAVAGLNPHAMFEEEVQDIVPAVQAARRAGIDAIGPISPDAVFRQAMEGVFDAVVTMYHDQGQIALKTAAFTGAWTVLLGLPYLRIGIPHGTAYDIAGTGRAQHASMLAALRAAAALATGKGILPAPNSGV